MLYLSKSALLTALLACNAQARELSFELIAGYEPTTVVTDHNAIDLDMKAMEEQLALGTDDSFLAAKRIYKYGGNSKSYAVLTIPSGLPGAVSETTPLSGKADSGAAVYGEAYANADAGATELKFKYDTTEIQETYMSCQVGGLTTTNLEGCLTAASGSTITIGGFSGDVEYNYTQATDNMNGRSISYFSETTEEKMRPKAGDPFYPDFQKFVDYYGNSQYADQFITAALDGSDTSFVNGNALFASVDAASRAEAVEKGSQYLAIAMYVIRELEDYVVTCQAGCTVDCDPDNSLDEAVAFYTGSLEGTSTDGTGKGVLFYTLANKRCNNFKTCGENGDSIEGTAKVNMNIFKAFNKMKEDNAAKNCDAVKASKEEIVRQMMVPLIQGTLRYAYLTQTAFEKKGEIEGASFAAAVLPWIHSCDKGSAETIYNNMKTGQAGTAKLSDVKQAFENTYSCLGITCADVGGIYDGSDYMDGASPCTGTGGSSSANRMAIGFATIVSAVALTLAIAV